MSTDSTKPILQIGEYWAKYWLGWQKNLFKIRQKPIAAVQKNMYDLKLLIEQFEVYNVRLISLAYCLFYISINFENQIISVNILYKIYSKYLNIQKSFTAIEYINEIGRDIPLILIITRIQ